MDLCKASEVIGSLNDTKQKLSEVVAKAKEICRALIILGMVLLLVFYRTKGIRRRSEQDNGE